MTHSRAKVIAQTVQTNPFNKFCGLKVVRQDPGQAVCRFEAGPNLVAGSGILHGGVLYALMDVACWVAVESVLGENEVAHTHDAHFSLMRPVAVGTAVELRSQVEKRGKTLAFSRVEAWSADASGLKLVAVGTVTKSILDRG